MSESLFKVGVAVAIFGRGFNTTVSRRHVCKVRKNSKFHLAFMRLESPGAEPVEVVTEGLLDPERPQPE